MPRLFLITPARDEADNLRRLETVLRTQSTPVDGWVIVENGSTDGSAAWLDTLTPGGQVRDLVVLHEDTGGSSVYALGSKYARLVARGMAVVRDRYGLRDDDAIGILDADTFPAPDYYQKILAAFAMRPGLGLTSGLTTDARGRISGHRRTWVRGSCRVWRGACLNESGYPIGPSADTLSTIKARCRGWEVAVVADARAEAREVGQRVSMRYYGQSAYFRGETLLHATLRALKYVARGRWQSGGEFLSGYLADWWKKAPRTDDPEILQWSRRALVRLLRLGSVRRQPDARPEGARRGCGGS